MSIMTRCVIRQLAALGPFGWTQTLNFIVVGLLTLAFAVGLVRLRGARHKSGGSWSVSGESA